MAWVKSIYDNNPISRLVHELRPNDFWTVMGSTAVNRHTEMPRTMHMEFQNLRPGQLQDIIQGFANNRGDDFHGDEITSGEVTLRIGEGIMHFNALSLDNMVQILLNFHRIIVTPTDKEAVKEILNFATNKFEFYANNISNLLHALQNAHNGAFGVILDFNIRAKTNRKITDMMRDARTDMMEPTPSDDVPFEDINEYESGGAYPHLEEDYRIAHINRNADQYEYSINEESDYLDYVARRREQEQQNDINDYAAHDYTGSGHPHAIQQLFDRHVRLHTRIGKLVRGHRVV
jgi:hypothetical protein